MLHIKSIQQLQDKATEIREDIIKERLDNKPISRYHDIYMMIPTLIRIPEEEYKIYKEFALEKGWSLAEFFRKAARSKTRLKTKKSKKKYSIWDLGTKIVYSGGPRDGSINADKYYYEFEANKRRLK